MCDAWVVAGPPGAGKSTVAGRPGSGRDTAKLAGFAAFTASMRLDTEPAAPHYTIDNRLDAGDTLEAQVTALVRQEDVR